MMSPYYGLHCVAVGLWLAYYGAWSADCTLRYRDCGLRIRVTGVRLQVAGCRLQNVNFGQQTVGTQMTFKTPPIPLTTAFTQSIAQPKKEAYPTIVTS